jgi:hypothetical protein
VAKMLLRREHVVAASLVGAVVVVVGFASGLGARPVIAGQAPSDDDSAGATPSAEPQQPPQDSAPRNRNPVHHNGSGGGGHVPVTNPPGTGHTGHPAPPTTPVPPPSSTPPKPEEPENPCAPGFVPRSLDTLLGTLTRATDTIDLLDGVPLESIGLAPTTVPTLLDGSAGLAPLDQLLATCEPATPTTTPPTTPPSPTTTPETAALPLPGLGG